MSDTPKKSKSRDRHSLSLNKRLNKRLSSPQNCILDTDNARDVYNSSKVEFTPPHKKPNLDESYDDSPSSFEGSFSPTAFLSQTYGSESPEVGWRWTKDDNESKTDSGFFSSNLSNSKDMKTRRLRCESNRQAYLNKREERRRAKELELRKAEKARIEKLLRERIAKLESQFKSRNGTARAEPEDNKANQIEKSTRRTGIIFDDVDDMFNESNVNFDEAVQVDDKSEEKADNILENIDDIFAESNINFDMFKQTTIANTDNHLGPIDDFFNDSDTDCMLVAATQQLESVIPELSQQTAHTSKDDNRSTDKHNEKTTAICMQKEKRSSLYMQFLDDDEDDFFVSLDDSWLQKATQPSKPRSPFQRYKSMPTTTSTLSSTSTSIKNAIVNNCKDNNTYPNYNSKNDLRNSSNTTNKLHTNKSIKRHASSHAISPSSSRFRKGQLPSRD